MTFTHLSMILAQDKTDMPKHRLLKTQGFGDQKLTRRITQMLLCPDNMCDMHERIINDHGIVVGRNAIRLDDDEITDTVRIKFHIATYQVMNHYGLIGGNTQTNTGLSAFSAQ